MQYVPEFLKSVEARLRCPADRRPAVIEELRGHLSDRVEALVNKGVPSWDAGHRAISEMGPPWLLALRLSAANGLNVTAYGLRHVWAAIIAIPALFAAVNPAYTWMLRFELWPEMAKVDSQARAILAAVHTGWIPWNLFGGSLVLLIGLIIFSFALGRIVRGWLWVIPPLLLMSWNLSMTHHPATEASRMSFFISLTCATAFVVSAYLGSRRERPRLHWLAWSSAGFILVCWLVVSGTAQLIFDAAPMGQLPHEFGVLQRQFLVSIYRDLTATITLVSAPWLLWFGAWLIERVNRPAGVVTG